MCSASTASSGPAPTGRCGRRPSTVRFGSVSLAWNPLSPTTSSIPGRSDRTRRAGWLPGSASRPSTSCRPSTCLDRHAHDGARVDVRRLLGVVGQARPTVLHLRDLRIPGRADASARRSTSPSVLRDLSNHADHRPAHVDDTPIGSPEQRAESTSTPADRFLLTPSATRARRFRDGTAARSLARSRSRRGKCSAPVRNAAHRSIRPRRRSNRSLRA